jgi:hypothetical protein
MFQVMIRNAVLAAVVAASVALTAAPALAGPAEQAYLAKLAATWVGSGKMSGPNGGPIGCRLQIVAGGSGARFTGRCTATDMGGRAFNGSIVYSDQRKRYESISTNGTVAGVKRGNSLVFADRISDARGSSYSTMTISPTSLSIAFTAVDSHGEKSQGTVNFSKG